jgi:hypothetical protein
MLKLAFLMDYRYGWGNIEFCSMKSTIYGVLLFFTHRVSLPEEEHVKPRIRNKEKRRNANTWMDNTTI